MNGLTLLTRGQRALRNASISSGLKQLSQGPSSTDLLGPLGLSMGSTFSRASTAWDGEKLAANNVPRIYGQNTRSPVVLLESTRTNFLPRSTDLTYWSKVRIASVTVSSILPPLPGQTVYKIVPDTVADLPHTISIHNGRGVGDKGLTFTQSAYVRAGEVPFARLCWHVTDGTNSYYPTAWWDLTAGVLKNFSFPAPLIGTFSTDIVPVGNGWYRCSLTGVLNSTFYPAGGTEVGAAGKDGTQYAGTFSGTEGFFVCAPQFEQGSFATSYIPTGIAAVVRSSDVWSFNGLAPLVSAGRPFTLKLATARIANRDTYGGSLTIRNSAGTELLVLTRYNTPKGIPFLNFKYNNSATTYPQVGVGSDLGHWTIFSVTYDGSVLRLYSGGSVTSLTTPLGVFDQALFSALAEFVAPGAPGLGIPFLRPRALSQSEIENEDAIWANELTQVDLSRPSKSPLSGVVSFYDFRRTNLTLSPEPLLADVPAKSAGVTQASFSEGLLRNGAIFPASSSSTEYFYPSTQPLKNGTTYNVSFFVVMGDASIPRVTTSSASNVNSDLGVVGSATLSSTPAVVTLVGNNVYRVSTSFTTAATGQVLNFAGCIRYTGFSNKTVRVTGFQVTESSAALTYEGLQTVVDKSAVNIFTPAQTDLRNWAKRSGVSITATPTGYRVYGNGQTDNLIYVYPLQSPGAVYSFRFEARALSGTPTLTVNGGAWYDSATGSGASVAVTLNSQWKTIAITARSGTPSHIGISAPGEIDYEVRNLILVDGPTLPPLWSKGQLNATLGATTGIDSTDPLWTPVGLQLDNVNDRVLTSVVLPGNTFTHSVAAAVNVAAGNGTNRCILWHREEPTKRGLMLYVNSSDQLALVKGTGTSFVSTYVGTPAGWTPATPSHYLLQLVNGTPTLFVNGVQIWTDTAANFNYLTTTVPVEYGSATFPMSGTLYHAVHYDRSLSEEERTALYNDVKWSLSDRNIKVL